MMAGLKGISIEFKNHPEPDGALATFTIDDCLIANNGGPAAARPQILIHLPKKDDHDVNGAFVNYDGYDWHVIGTTVPQMEGNTPTRWDRYAIAERFRML